MPFKIALLFILGWIWRCEDQNKATKKINVPIARVKDQYLYKQDLENLKVDLHSPQDTIGLVDHYIQSWIAKQVLIAEAEKHGEYQKADIERKILDYKYALIVHSYLEKLVNSKLDNYISEEEINQYYQEYQENFALKHPIVRGKFVIIAKDAPDRENLKIWINSKQEADKERLKAYCSQFAKNYSLDEVVWLNWNEVITKTPFYKMKDKTRLLKKGNFTEIKDEHYIYYLKIDTYKVVGEVAPVELVREQIVDVILYKRKLALANQVKEDILQKAKANHAYTVYDY
jgi:hypothetical protein